MAGRIEIQGLMSEPWIKTNKQTNNLSRDDLELVWFQNVFYQLSTGLWNSGPLKAVSIGGEPFLF